MNPDEAPVWAKELRASTELGLGNLERRLTEKIDGVEQRLEKRMGSFEARITRKIEKMDLRIGERFEG